MLCVLDMAIVLDPSESEVQAATEAGREILVRLGAGPFVERLDDAQGRREPREPAPQSPVRATAKP